MFATIALALALQAGAEKPAEPQETGETVEVIAQEVLSAETVPDVTSQTAADNAMEPQGDSVAHSLVIPRDTPVHLMVINEVSTKDHSAGHRFPLRVDQPVIVDGKEMVPVGTTAWGELTEAEKSGNTGKRGKLSAILTHIDLDGKTIPIEGGTEADGKSGKGETILGVLAMGPLGLFAKGNNAKIKAGEKMTAFVSEDVVLDHGK